MKNTIKNTIKRANGDGSIYYEKSRERWACAVVDPSGKRIVKRFKTEQEAKNHLTVVKSSIITNDYIQPSQLTFGQWLIDYLKLYVKPTATLSTINIYVGYCNYADPLNNVPLQKLTTNMLQKLINDLPDTLNNTTRNCIASLFKRALKKACDTRLITYNPMQGVLIPKKEKPEIETFTIDEMNTILNYLSTKPSLHRNYVLIKTLFTSGLRIGEALALQDTDILDDRIIVSKSIKLNATHKTVIGNTKNKKTREVTLPASVIADLKTLKPNDNGYIFYSRTSKGLIIESNIQEAWVRIVKRSGIEYKSLHAIRHTHATQLLENGVSITEVSKRLGHSNVTITLNTYSHVLRDEERKNTITDKVSQIFQL